MTNQEQISKLNAQIEVLQYTVNALSANAMDARQVADAINEAFRNHLASKRKGFS